MKPEHSADPPQASAGAQRPYTRAAEALIVSEVRYRRLFEAARDGILILDADNGEIVDVNPFLIELLGFPREQFLGKEVWEIGAFKDIFASQDKFIKLQKVGYVRYDDLPLQTVDGRMVPVEFVSNVYQEGRRKVIQCNIRDITGRKRADGDRLRLAAIVDQTSDAIISADIQGVIVSWNPGAQKLFGFSPGEAIGQPLTMLAPDGRSIEIDKNRSLVLQGGSIQYEAKRLTKDGKEIDVWAAISPIKGAAGAVAGVSGIYRDMTGRKKAEAELERLRTAIEQAGEAIVVTDDGGAILHVNAAFETTTGYSRQEAAGKTPRILKSGKHDEAFYRSLWDTISSGRTWKGRLVDKRKDGSLHTVDGTISPVLDRAGRIVNYVAVRRDVTEQIRLESELLQAQKMESVGRLAGGVAHDFNNLLTAINGYAEFVLEGLAEDDPKRQDVKEILAAGGRAAGLTRQLLAFSRKQILNLEVVDIHASVGATGKMLRRLIGEDIKLESKLAAHPCLIKADVGQIEQVLLNLAVNARDAMPQGGTLTFETRIAAADDDFSSKHPDLPRGPLVCLSVRDTGCGMIDEVRAHLFEPFFTTKEKGKGTGLGLAMVFGIIKQSGGDIEVESAPDRGTTFRIYLPQIDASAQNKDRVKDRDKDVVLRGDETVLFVEDEDIILRLGERSLTGSGYTVLTAVDGSEALEVLERHGRPVDLLVTDVVMPDMSGRDLAREIARKNMARRTLFISGYTDDAIVRHGVLEPGLAFLYKPFSPKTLLSKLREVLDGPADKAKA
jgi:PAS domain S-box-containing protein